MSKWIEFQGGLVFGRRKTRWWSVRTTDGKTTLGEIKWQKGWRKYAFFPFVDTVYEEDCLRDIATFCESQTKVHKKK